MHTIKIMPNLLFEYQCTSGKFIRLSNRIESKKIENRIESNRIETFLPELECSNMTLTFISIILQTLSPLSFYLFSLLLILVNMSTSLRMIKITLLI